MSFTKAIKDECCSLNIKKPCCRKSEAYGLLFFGNFFSSEHIGIKTDDIDIAEYIEKSLRHIFKIKPIVFISESFGSQIYNIKINDKESRDAVFSKLGIESSDKPDKKVFDRSCCIFSFLRGVFLSCGSASNPDKDYRLEFTVYNKSNSASLYEILSENGFTPKTTVRSGYDIVYIKGKEQVENYLTCIGATTACLSLISTEIEKDIRNRVNRQNNCEIANIGKTITAGAKQIEAIEKIRRTIGLAALSDILREAAELRLANPDLPLSQLVKLSPTPVSRSGLNHRLQKIVSIAENI